MGGIWQTTSGALNRTQSSETLWAQQFRNDISDDLNINITDLNRAAGDLDIPLNAIAVSRMFVAFYESVVPIPMSLADQAAYWVSFLTIRTLGFQISLI